jgi:hypothetical protein
MAELVQGARLRYTLTPQLAIVSWSRKGRGFESHSYHLLFAIFAPSASKRGLFFLLAQLCDFFFGGWLAENFRVVVYQNFVLFRKLTMGEFIRTLYRSRLNALSDY